MALAKRLQHSDLEPVGPGTPAGRYLRSFWQPVMRIRDLKPGRAKPLEILGEKFTIYRDEGGTPHVVAFRCPHRGTQLSLGWVEGSSLRCRYHGWRYDSTGQCVEQPNEDRPFCDKVKMPTYPTREYVGLIFAYLGEGAPPEFRHYPDFDRPGVIVTDPPEILPCTFWNKLENDTGHVPWVHRATALRRGRKSNLILRTETVEETEFGFRVNRFFRDAPKDTPPDIRYSAFWFLPNARQFWQPTRAKGYEGRGLMDTKMTWTVPVNDQKFVAFDVTHTPLEGKEGEVYASTRYAQQEAEAETRWDLAEQILAGNLTPEELPQDIGIYTSFAIEDYITQVGQGSITGRGPEQLSLTDAKPLYLRRLWLREVTALLEGKPLTDWKMPTEPLFKSDLMAKAV